MAQHWHVYVCSEYSCSFNLPWTGSRPQTVPILTRLQELLECEQRLDEKAAELMEVTAELQRVQKVAGR